LRFKNLLPILEWLPTYNKSDFRGDLIASITVAIMLVPQGMAYAFLAGMPPIYGLYGGLVPLALYAVLGTSRQLSIGPVAVSALLVLAGVCQIEAPGCEAYIELVILAGLLIGLCQFLLGVLRMGFLINFLSHPVLVGFTSAAAIIIGVSQLKDLLGFEIPRFTHTYETFWYAVQHLGETNWIAVLMCLGSLAVILTLRAIKKSLPGALIVVVVGTLLAWGLNLEEFGLDIIKGVPEGLPAFTIPEITFENIRQLIPVVLTVSIIGIVESISIAKVLESKHSNYDVRPNQELLALGLSKIGGAFFQSLPTSASFTRSAVNNDAGARTGMSSLITVLFIILTLLFLTPLFYYLPKAVLAAIILLALKSLFDFKGAMYLWKTHKQDFAMMLLTFVVTLVSGIEHGVLTGVVVSILAVLYRSSNPHIVVLGKIPGTTSYRNVKRFETEDLPEGIVAIRFDDQLYFANANQFKDSIKSLVKNRKNEIEALILDAGSIHEMDSSGLHVFEEVYSFLKRKNISFYLTGTIGPVRDLLAKSELMGKIGPYNQFLKTHDVVTYHQSKKSKGTPPPGWTVDAIQTNLNEED